MTPTFDAFHLPVHVEVSRFRTTEAGRLVYRYPDPTRDLLEALVERLRRAREDLVARPVAELVEVVDAAASRLADSGAPLRAEALRLLPLATGYSAEMAALVLDRMVADWRAEPLRRLLHAELNDPRVLDGFTSVGEGRAARAYGPLLSFHVFAGNVPGVAVTSLIRSLLVKSPAAGKTAEGEPVLPVLFARALRDVDPAIADALAVTYWPGGSEAAERQLARAADLTVLYGGAEAVAALRELTPPDRRLVVHGPRLSVAMIGAPALAPSSMRATAARLARAVAMFDQHGCVSPQAVWVEDPEGDAAARFAEALAGQMDRLEDELPRGAVSPAEASAIQQARGAAELRGYAGDTVRVYAGGGTLWTVVYDADPTFRPSCLNRFVRIHPVTSLDDAVPLLAPVASHLQSVALEVPAARVHPLAHRLAELGASRITTLERLPWPPAEWHHDGSAPLRELLRWVDLES